MELSLIQLFGAEALQDSQTLIIKKSDLNLTPIGTNTAESLFVALLVKAFENFQGSLTDPDNNLITDNQGNTVTYDNSQMYDLMLIQSWESFIQEKNNALYVTDTFIIDRFSEYADTEFS